MHNVLNYLNNKLNENDVIVLALSGGPDSMCLLHLLIELRKKKNYKIICAHVNHNLRKESNDEEIFVRKYCLDNNIIFEYMKIDHTNVKNYKSEAINREIRYRFFNDIIKKYTANYMLTAHHGDDLMETILMRIVRGSTIRGYAGFKMEQKYDNYSLLRPLISVTKNDIYMYLKENNLEFVIDNSNYNDTYTRNRYRKYVIPKLKEENSNVNLKFLTFSEKVFSCATYIDSIINNYYNIAYDNKTIYLNEFVNLDYFIKKMIIDKVFSLLYKDNIDLISDKHIIGILELSQLNNSKQYRLPNNIIAIKEYDKIIFNEPPLYTEYCMEFTKKFEFNNKKITIIDNSDSDSNYICRLNKSEVAFPLYIRTIRNGDKMEVKNLDGSKKISDIFKDSKISLIERKTYPIVVDSNGNIVWLPGIKKSKFDRTKNEKYDIILKYY